MIFTDFNDLDNAQRLANNECLQPNQKKKSNICVTIVVYNFSQEKLIICYVFIASHSDNFHLDVAINIDSRI